MKKYTQKDYIKNNIDLSNIKTFDDYIVATVEGYVKNGNPVDKWMFEQYKSIIAFNAMSVLVNNALKSDNTIYKQEGEFFTKTVNKSYNTKNNDNSVKKESFLKRMWNSITRKNK